MKDESQFDGFFAIFAFQAEKAVNQEITLR